MPDLSSTEFSKAPKHTQHESAAGVRIAPGPFIGIVKNNVDPMRSGRLQVYIPELGGNPDEVESWRTVMYCTPFYGVTPAEVRGSGQDPVTNPHSYGFFAVPPDIGVKVICTFVNGDPYRGYWFGCVPEWPNMNMVPAIAGGVVEYNDNGDPATIANFAQMHGPAHPFQSQTYQKQGLSGDKNRGPLTSSVFRETPSRVIGLSTPGAPLGNPSYQTTADGTADQLVRGRKGGHTIVMDDGDQGGNSQLMRFRTTAGHMIMMNDTAGFIYVINAAGTAWFELDAKGSINVYAQNQVNIKAKAGFQIDTDGAIKLNGKKSIDINTDGALKLNGKSVDINSGGDLKLTASKDVHVSSKSAYITGSSCIELSGGKHMDVKAGCVTINTKQVKAAQKAGKADKPQNMPDHEPWSGHTGGGGAPSSNASSGARFGTPTGPADGYGAQGGFSGTAPDNYLWLTNDVGPAKAVAGFSGNLDGQGSASGAADTSATQYDVGATSMTGTSMQAPNVDMGIAVNVQTGASVNTNNIVLVTGEKSNNPGNLAFNSQATAVGASDSYAVFANPEDGFYELAKLLLSYADGKPITLIDLITKLRPLTTASNPLDYAKKLLAVTGFELTTLLNLSLPDTLRKVVIAIANQEQGRFLWDYDQVEGGVARAQGRAPVYVTAVKPWQNTGSQGYVPPTATSSGASPIKVGSSLYYVGVGVTADGGLVFTGGYGSPGSSASGQVSYNAGTGDVNYGGSYTSNGGYTTTTVTGGYNPTTPSTGGSITTPPTAPGGGTGTGTGYQPITADALAKLPSGLRNDQAFVDSVNTLAQRYNATGNDVLAVMQVESGFNPSIVNSFGYTGLIQIGGSNFAAIGYSSAQIAKMSPSAQVAGPVTAYFDQWAGKLPQNPTRGDLYMAVALPGYIGKPDNQVLYAAGSKVAQNNPAWRDANGNVTAGSVRAYVNSSKVPVAPPLTVPAINSNGPAGTNNAADPAAPSSGTDPAAPPSTDEQNYNPGAVQSSTLPPPADGSTGSTPATPPLTVPASGTAPGTPSTTSPSGFNLDGSYTAPSASFDGTKYYSPSTGTMFVNGLKPTTSDYAFAAYPDVPYSQRPDYQGPANYAPNNGYEVIPGELTSTGATQYRDPTSGRLYDSLPDAPAGSNYGTPAGRSTAGEIGDYDAYTQTNHLGENSGVTSGTFSGAGGVGSYNDFGKTVGLGDGAPTAGTGTYSVGGGAFDVNGGVIGLGTNQYGYAESTGFSTDAGYGVSAPAPLPANDWGGGGSLYTSPTAIDNVGGSSFNDQILSSSGFSTGVNYSTDSVAAGTSGATFGDSTSGSYSPIGSSVEPATSGQAGGFSLDGAQATTGGWSTSQDTTIAGGTNNWSYQSDLPASTEGVKFGPTMEANSESNNATTGAITNDISAPTAAGFGLGGAETSAGRVEEGTKDGFTQTEGDQSKAVQDQINADPGNASNQEAPQLSKELGGPGNPEKPVGGGDKEPGAGSAGAGGGKATPQGSDQTGAPSAC